MDSEYNAEIVDCKVMASANGYPLLRGLVKFKSVKDAKIVQSVCNQMELFGNRMFVRFHCENASANAKKVSFAGNEIDSDGEDDIMEMDDASDSDSESEEIGSDDLESFSDDDKGSNVDDAYKSKFGLKEKDIRGLWKWCNPNKKYPNGLLTERRFGGKYKKNWKELRSKDWIKEWKKSEKIAGQDKYYIRGGDLVNASAKWRQRAKSKKLRK